MKAIAQNPDKAAKVIGNIIVAICAAGALVYCVKGVAMQVAHNWNW